MSNVLEFIENGTADKVAEAIANATEALFPPGQLYPSIVLKKARQIIKSRPLGNYIEPEKESAGDDPLSNL